jgi:hypothetical protein
MTTYTHVSARAVLVSLHVSTWSARKFDKKVTKEVNDSKGAEANASRVNKHLLAGAVSHERVLKAAQALRDLHYKETLPWTDEGKRLLPTKNYLDYTTKMRDAFAAFDRAVAAFEADYPALKAQAPTLLGALYNADEFPKESEIAGKFARDFAIDPVPEKGDIRCDLPEDQVAAIEVAMARRLEQAARDASKDAWERLREAIVRISKATAEKVEGQRASSVRDTLIVNVQRVCDSLARLNIAEDADLDALREETARAFASVTVEDLRDNEALRAATKRKADDLLAKMGVFAAPVAA